jgi:NAD(P)-dependent dehydrogenase (short-subunit alcohol dehydrogenase family)
LNTKSGSLSQPEPLGATDCQIVGNVRTMTTADATAPKRVAVITGGSRGLGFEVARGLARNGFNLVLVAKDLERLTAAKAKLNSEFGSGIEITTHAVDFESQSATRQAATQIAATLTPDIFILAHGVMSEKMSKTLKTTDEEWNRVMSINLDSVFTLINAIAPKMVEKREGRIIVFSACLGRMSGPGNAGGLAPYRISKSGVNALVRNLAHETGLGARGILVDAICPNHSRTDMGGPDAPRSAEEGAETAVWLAIRKFDFNNKTNESESITGVLWEDHQIVPW